MVNKDDAIEQVRKILEKSGIPKEIVDEWMKDPKAAVESQKTEILIQVKNRIVDITNQLNAIQLQIIELQKQVSTLNAWKWRQEGK